MHNQNDHPVYEEHNACKLIRKILEWSFNFIFIKDLSFIAIAWWSDGLMYFAVIIDVSSGSETPSLTS